MANRTTHGRERDETDRVKDLPKRARTVRDPHRGRDRLGRFGPGNDAAKGRGYRGLIRDSLSAGTDEETVRELAEVMLTTYKADVSSMPAQTPSVLAEAAAAARHSVLGSYFAREAGKAGLITPLGLKLAEAARQHDLSAQRHRTAAFTRAARVAEDQDAMERRSRPSRVLEALQRANERRTTHGEDEDTED